MLEPECCHATYAAATQPTTTRGQGHCLSQAIGRGVKCRIETLSILFDRWGRYTAPDGTRAWSFNAEQTVGPSQLTVLCSGMS
jgi:hypothetical protein